MKYPALRYEFAKRWPVWTVFVNVSRDRHSIREGWRLSRIMAEYLYGDRSEEL